MARQLVVEIVGDASKFNAATKGAIAQSQTLTGKLQGVGKGMVLGAGIGAFNLLTGAISSAVGMMGEMRLAYQEDQVSQQKLATSLQSNVERWDGQTAAIEKVIAAQMRLGFSDDEQRSSLAELAGVTRDVTEAQELQSLAMDLARFKNLDLGTASDILGKVYAGNMGTLSRYGIVLEEGATSTEALAAIQKLAAGQAEAYADTSLGKEEAAHLKVAEAQEKVGKILDEISTVIIPIAADAITTLVDGFSDFWEATQPIRTALGPILVGVFGVIGDAVSGVFETIGSVIDAIKTVIDAIKTAIGLAEDLAGGGIAGSRAPGGFGTPGFNTGPGSTFSGPGGGGTSSFGGLVPRMHDGGIVPGRAGTETLAILQAGERVTPNGAIGGSLTLQAGAIVISGVTDPEEVARKIMQALKREQIRQGMSLA